MHKRIPIAAILAAGLALPGLVFGTDSQVIVGSGTAPATMSEPALPVIETIEIPMPATSAFGDAIDPERLDSMRGGDGNVSTTTNRADLRGGVNGNTATNVIGGGNLVSDGSFGNAEGISTVIQNSCSNVLIQNSTIVNVQFVPSP